MTRVCKKCGTEKELEEFELDSRKKYGRTNRCRDCAREYKRLDAIKHHDRRLEKLRKWREANPEEYKARKHAEYLKHKDRYNAGSKKWYQENKEKVREQGKRWRAENKELKAERDKAYVLEHKDKIREYKRIYIQNKRENDLEYNITNKLRQRLRHAVRRGYKNERTKKLLGCTVEFLMDWLEAQFTEGMTWEAFLVGDIHVDHIRPCASFDLTDPVQQRICFNYRNLQPLWAVDNMQKHNKWDSSDENIWANKPINDLLVEIQHIQYIV